MKIDCENLLKIRTVLRVLPEMTDETQFPYVQSKAERRQKTKPTVNILWWAIVILGKDPSVLMDGLVEIPPEQQQKRKSNVRNY